MKTQTFGQFFPQGGHLGKLILDIYIDRDLSQELKKEVDKITVKDIFNSRWLF